MSHNRTFKLLGLMLAALMLVVAGAASLSYAVGDRLCGCGATTPCPCAADGICRPKRETWGFYTTRWRTWPGEQTDSAPTPADQAPDEAEQLDALPGYETPKPEQEDLRVPPKSKKKQDEEESAPLELPGEDPAQLLPGPGDAPAEDAPLDLDPFGSLPELPQMEDAPPALPASLRQAAISMSMPRVSMQRRTPATTQPTAPRTNITPEMLAQPIRQVSWDQPTNMPLINPASAIQTSASKQPLQQAIYFEASDRDE